MSRIAVFDIGTVTCRLGIFDVEAGKISKTVFKDLEICNLGNGVDASGCLQDTAIDSVLTCLKRFVAQARSLDSDVCICTLTSAARDAQNSEYLLSKIEALGIYPQVISGSIEAQLSFLGVAQDFPNQSIAVMDSGGGSTELCVGRLDPSHGLDIEWIHSYNVGARRLTERFLSTTNGDSEEVRQKALKEARAVYAAHTPPTNIMGVKLIGVGGTATTLSAIEQRLSVYDPELVHLSQLSLDTIDSMGRWIVELSVEERTNIKGLQPKRAEVIVGGICAVEALMQVNNFDSLIISENDILCGLAICADSSFKYEENVVEWKPQLFNL